MGLIRHRAGHVILSSAGNDEIQPFDVPESSTGGRHRAISVVSLFLESREVCFSLSSS